MWSVWRTYSNKEGRRGRETQRSGRSLRSTLGANLCCRTGNNRFSWSCDIHGKWAKIDEKGLYQLKMIFPEDVQVNRMKLSLSNKIILRYIVIYQNLDFCYDQMVHPQKRCFLVLIFSFTKKWSHMVRSSQIILRAGYSSASCLTQPSAGSSSWSTSWSTLTSSSTASSTMSWRRWRWDTDDIREQIRRHDLLGQNFRP